MEGVQAPHRLDVCALRSPFRFHGEREHLGGGEHGTDDEENHPLKAQGQTVTAQSQTVLSSSGNQANVRRAGCVCVWVGGLCRTTGAGGSDGVSVRPHTHSFSWPFSLLCPPPTPKRFPALEVCPWDGITQSLPNLWFLAEFLFWIGGTNGRKMRKGERLGHFFPLPST